MKLAGLDIGFSTKRRSNALAVFDGATVVVDKLNLVERNAAIASLIDVDVIAIDAPLLPSAAQETLVRSCEMTFVRGAFQTRCKPGMSHVPGTGRQLREHGSAAGAAARTTATLSNAVLPRISPHAIVEAFPNAFLGVVLANRHYLNRGAIRRGKKFDWLYDKWVAGGLFIEIVSEANLPPKVGELSVTERDHDKRAALVCLLTAAFAAQGDYVAVGDERGGFFFLPPKRLWATWAWSEVATAAVKAGARVLEHSSIFE